MFTGIVEEIGAVSKLTRGERSAAVEIRAETVLTDAKVGDSIAVNGVCLTVTALGRGTFTADAVRETMERSTLGRLRTGSHVNLERAMPANGRFGGHLVAGHIDGTGKIVRVQKDDNAVWLTVQAAPDIMRYVVTKGSVALDGISLTIARVSRESFAVSVIPHTVRHTVLCERREGDLLNIETDIMGKYVEKLLAPPKQTGTGSSNITEEFLEKCGF